MLKQAELRSHLERLPPGALLNAGVAAVYLDVSTKTLARWRERKNMGPPFLEPVVAEGAPRSTQPYKYRKSDLDVFVSGRLSAGGLAFANQVMPWALDEAGAIVGNALDRLSIVDLLDTDPWVATLLDALAEPWATAAAMQPYRDELESAMRQAMVQVDSSLQTLQLEERTGPATGKPRRDAGL